MSLADFRNWTAEDGFKYEWDNGILRAKTGMKIKERMIVARLLRRFSQTKAYQNGGELLPEAETFFEPVGKLRIPDLAYFTKEELLRSEQGEETIPKFIVEIISPTNTVDEIQTKLKDYFTSGVQMVWEIFPKHQLVRVYASLKEAKICIGDDICSAAPIIPDFQIAVNQIFNS
ncbi:MAG: Uma2 family endonuclease [Chloroherpetonaceae bacterium]|nr:Uma2 family endonuclease [Chloroherpetonaceae bacterium]